MKLLPLLLALLISLRIAAGQPVGVTATNQIIFSTLLSTNETPLMTNAEFRCTQGIKVFFCTPDYSQYQNFDAREIDTNQLARMGIDLFKMEDDQTRLQEEREKFEQEEAAGQAAAAAARAEQAAAATSQSTNQPPSASNKSTNSSPHKHRHRN